jgi:hypothetical protein
MNADLAWIRVQVLDFLAYDDSCGGHVASVWPAIIRCAYPVLADLTLVDQIMSFVHRILRNWSVAENLSRLGEPLLDFVEFCAGRGMLTRGMIYHGYRCAAFDINYDASHDMLSGPGLRLFLDALTSTRRRGMHWWGTKCSSFVNLCISVSERNAFNAWLGNQERHFVQEGNQQAEVTALGIFLGALCGLLSILEQPTSSVMPRTPSLQNVFAFFNFHRQVVWMGAYSGPSPKPLQLWHPPSLDLSRLGRPKPIGLDAGLVMQGSEMEVGQESRTDWKLQSITHLSLAALWQSVLTLLCRWMAEMI